MKRLVLIVLCNILIIDLLVTHLGNTSFIHAIAFDEDSDNEAENPEALETNFLISIKTLCTLTYFMAVQYSLEGCCLRFDTYLNNCQHPCLYGLLQAIDILDLKLYKKSYDQPCYSIVLYEAYLILNYIVETQSLVIASLGQAYQEIILDIGSKYQRSDDAALVCISSEQINLLFQAVKAYLLACFSQENGNKIFFQQAGATLERERICQNMIVSEQDAERFTGFEREHFQGVYNFIKSYSRIESTQQFFENSLWAYKHYYILAMYAHAGDRYLSS